MKKFINLGVLLLSISLLSSCYVMNMHQTGKTLGKGNYEFQLITGRSNLSTNANNSVAPNVSSKQVTSIQFAYGLKDKIDIGGIVGNDKVGVFAKHQIIGHKDSKFAMSYGAYFKKFNVTLFVSEENHIVGIPLFISFHPIDQLSFYSNPVLSYINIEPGANEAFNIADGVFNSGFYKGLSTGVMWELPNTEKKFKIIPSLEVSCLSPINTNEVVFFTTIGFGVKIPSKKNKNKLNSQ